LPTPTPTPVTSRRDAEGIVWARVSGCVEQVAKALGATGDIQVTLATRYDPVTKAWTVEASTQDPRLTFGTWGVSDATGEVAPQDQVARGIAAPGVTCSPPTVFLAASLTPPQLVTAPLPTAVATPAPKAEIASAQEATLRLWVQVYGCYDHFPQASSFTAYPDRPGRFVVEGRSEESYYGLWAVDTQTGQVTPLDALAKHTAETCRPPVNPSSAPGPLPQVVVAQQATIRIWISLYNCFSPPPALSNFTAYTAGPQQWVVEGRKETIAGKTVERKVGDTTETFTETQDKVDSYGVWLVKTATGALEPWDASAKTIAKDTCFQPP
ncbi:MAG: hypothetical protein HY535_02405, partial [Chloroflexi bacterium]|nr:hypothetical protein [Chloroflexota bacterium]